MSMIYKYYNSINNYDDNYYIKDLTIDKFKESLHFKNTNYQLSR